MNVIKTNLQQLADCIEQHSDPEPFSGVVHMMRQNEVIFEEAYGLAIKAESIPNTTNTRFQMASGCKIFTSVAICQLVERRKLGFDTLLSECVDVAFPNYAPDITIHHLLTHTSGITSYFEEEVDPDFEALWQCMPMYKVRKPRDFLPLFQDKSMKFSPGKRFDYNDGGYILLGLVIECVTDRDFSEYIEEKVFEPAGMKESGYFPTDQLPEKTAYAYIKTPDDTWRTNFFAVPILGAPDGGAYTTAPEMAAFWKALTGKKLLTAEMTKLLLEPHIATTWKSPYTHYGYGVWIDRPKEVMRKYFVEGSDPGVALRSTYYPDEDLVLTIIGNTGDALWPLYNKLEKILAL